MSTVPCSVSIDELKNDPILPDENLSKANIFDADIESLKGHSCEYSDNALYTEENFDIRWLLRLYANHRTDSAHVGKEVVEELDRLLMT